MTGKRFATALAASSALVAVALTAVPASAQTLEDLQAQIQKLQKQMDDLKAVQTAEKKSSDVKIGLRGGPTLETSDGNFKFQLGGRVHFDAAYYDDDISDLRSGFLFRRARLSLEMTLYKDWFIKTQYDFAENGVSASDIFVQYRGFTDTAITVGQFKVPFGLEELASSNNITFMERSTPTALFASSRRLGVGIDYGNDLFTVGAAVYGRNVGTTTVGDDPIGFGARVTVAPINEKTAVLHFGAAAAVERMDDTGVIRLRDRPESRVDGERLIDTGNISNVRRIEKFGLEAAGVYGPFSVQGEYMKGKIKRENGFADASYDGWYAMASWLVTGESRSYRGGTFGGVTPKNEYGAIELAARYSVSDLNDFDLAFNNQGGEMKILTLGVNYYINRNFRVMLNYLNVNRDLFGPRPGDEPNIFQARVQATF